jgi:hypothetical protein
MFSPELVVFDRELRKGNYMRWAMQKLLELLVLFLINCRSS